MFTFDAFRRKRELTKSEPQDAEDVAFAEQPAYQETAEQTGTRRAEFGRIIRGWVELGNFDQPLENIKYAKKAEELKLVDPNEHPSVLAAANDELAYLNDLEAAVVVERDKRESLSQAA